MQPSLTQHGTADFTRTEIGAHLKRMFSSSAFASSKRCQDFLRYVVEQSLDGGAESIKERTIAADVFGRGGTYEPSEDSGVRVKAGEVRKRLALYYDSEGAGEVIRIELPLGNYAPVFHRLPVPETAHPKINRQRVTLIAAGATLAFIALITLWPREAAIERFWAPVWNRGEPVTLCLPIRETYYLMGDAVTAFRDKNLTQSRSRSGDSVYQIPVAQIGSKGVLGGIGDSQGLANLAAFCTRNRRRYNVKVVDDTSFADLRKNSTVLLGAFSSRWTLEVCKDLRFVFDGTGDKARIVDTRQPGRFWSPKNPETNAITEEDYAVIGRVYDVKSGQVVVIAAGITTFGTQSAAEFITDPVLVEQLVSGAPAKWESKNVQAVIHTKVIGKTPGKPRIVSAHFW
jgi:hypothetical protein